MAQQLSIGFIGFGEAGYHLAQGLRGAGLTGICAYDLHTQTAGRGEKIQHRAHEAAVTLCDTNEQLAAACDILLSTVTANQATAAAQETAPYLTARHFYADLNSVSPAVKQTIGQLIEAHNARFVEIAIMSPVPPHGLAVPMFLGGVHAPAFAALLTPLGMKLEVISAQIGAAAATKMCRSVIVKGLEALLFESVLAAVPYGADERVFATLQETMPGLDWQKLASYMVGRVIEHGERRARELEEVAATLEAIGVEPMMTNAIVRRQDWGARLNLLPELGGKSPDDYRVVVNAIRAREQKKD